jgi:pre-rRNA-processing protein TSR3
MQPFVNPWDQTIVWRHRKENLKKCSLRGLESRKDFHFYSYPNQALPDLSSYIMLTLDAPPLELKDGVFGLLILDATWRYAEDMTKRIEPMQCLKRSIPSHYRTAYPRKQTECIDPERGLASIEAIYIAYHIFGRDTAGLLDNYYWKESFLTMNGFL